jgi:hypothetical protein
MAIRGAKQRFAIEHVAEALRKGAGIASAAAKHLRAATGRGCTPKTIHNYIARYPSLQRTLDETIDANLDLAESKLLLAIDAGADWAVKFYLETQGRRRGYARRQEVAGVPGAPVMVGNVATARDWLAAELDQMDSRLRDEPSGANGAAAESGEGSPPEETVH